MSISLQQYLKFINLWLFNFTYNCLQIHLCLIFSVLSVMDEIQSNGDDSSESSIPSKSSKHLDNLALNTHKAGMQGENFFFNCKYYSKTCAIDF